VSVVFIHLEEKGMQQEQRIGSVVACSSGVSDFLMFF
jgi:hypothetical protein